MPRTMPRARTHTPSSPRALQAKATSAGKTFFVMESPAGSSGKAKCGFGQDYQSFAAWAGVQDSTTSLKQLQIGDQECNPFRMAEPTGAPFKMAVYELRSYLQARPSPRAVPPPAVSTPRPPSRL